MKRILLVVVALCVVAGVGFFVFMQTSKEQVLTFDGVGPVKLGMTVPDAEAALGVKLTPMDPTNEIDTEACWRTTRADGQDLGIVYMVWNGKIVRIDVFRYDREKPKVVVPRVVTEKNIRLSSSVNDVREAYGADLDVEFHSQGDVGNYDLLYMTVPSADKQRGLLFETYETGLEYIGVAIAPALKLQEGCL